MTKKYNKLVRDRIPEIEKHRFHEETRCLVVEISRIEPLLFVCLKDSQDPKTKKNADLLVGVVEISGMELLLFVCLKDSQQRKRPTSRLVLVEISGIEPLLFVCLKDSQNPKTKKNADLTVGVVEISGIEPLTS